MGKNPADLLEDVALLLVRAAGYRHGDWLLIGGVENEEVDWRRGLVMVFVGLEVREWEVVVV